MEDPELTCLNSEKARDRRGPHTAVALPGSQEFLGTFHASSSFLSLGKGLVLYPTI